MGRVTSLVFAFVLAFGGQAALGEAPAHASTLPTISAGDVTIAEGDSGISVAKASIDLSASSAFTVSARWTLTQGSADGTDAKLGTGTMNFLAGATTKAVSIRVYGDSVVEPDQTLQLVLSNVVGATPDRNGTVTILDDDANGPAAGIEVNLGVATVRESDAGTHYAFVPITLSAPATAPFTVYYTFNCSSGTGNTSVSGKRTGSLTFLINQQSKTLRFAVGANVTVNGDAALIEGISLQGGPAVTARTLGGVVVQDDEGTAPGPIERVSVASDGSESQIVDFSTLLVPGGLPLLPGWDCAVLNTNMTPAMSGDGRYVAFASNAVDLVPGDTNGVSDAFRHDRTTGSTERISLKNDGSQIGVADAGPTPGVGIRTSVKSISGDGRFVVITTNARLVPQDTGTGPDLYVIDTSTHTSELVSVALDGTAANDPSIGVASMSADGQRITFESSASTLTVGDIDPPDVNFFGTIIRYNEDVFVRDRQTGVTTLVSATANPAGAWARTPAISADGQHITFQGSKTITAGTDISTELFGYDVATGTIEDFGFDGANPSLSADGRYLTFNTYPSNGTWQVYLRDRATGVDERIDADGPNLSTLRTVDPGVASISADGRYVAFNCSCQRSTAGYGHLGVYRRDRVAGTTAEVDLNPAGTVTDLPWQQLERGGMSQDGSAVAFASTSTDLVPGDTNSMVDVFIRTMT